MSGPRAGAVEGDASMPASTRLGCARLGCVSAALAVATSLTSAPASADVRDFADPPRAAPGAIDIRNVRVDNATARPSSIIVRVRLRDIDFGDGMTVYVDTRPRNAGPEYKIEAFADSEFVLRRVDTWAARGRNVRCDDDRVSMTQSSRRARFVFPRTCVANPGRVRIAVHAFREGSSDWAKARRTWLGFVRR